MCRSAQHAASCGLTAHCREHGNL
ncbi:MAG: hypothetical protein CBC34_000205 [Hyphomicrobiaceae bacterium TMED74]|nr:MAG: hypothetical protein CBC34_000205 [Hyphomicrobiaceae bacterium TMED74]